MIHRYLECLFAILQISCVFYLSSGESISDKCHACRTKKDEDCKELFKPGWKIDSLANITLDAWPWNCLNWHFDHSSALEKAISVLSPSVHKAASKGYIGFVQYYVEIKDVDLMIPDKDGRTPLQLAILNKHTKVVKYITVNDLQIACAYSNNVTFFNGRDEVQTIHYGLPLMMKYLVSQIEVDSSYNDTYMNEAIRKAVKAGNLFLLKYLVDEKGFDINQMDGNLLLLSATAGNVDLIKYLINEKKFDVEKDQAFGETSALHEAALAGQLEAVRFFIEIMKYPVDLRCEYGATPAHFATRGGSLNVLKYLIEEKGAHLFATYRLGSTLLHQAAMYGHLTIVKYLINQKFMDVDSKDLLDKTPLYRAFEAGKLEVITYLIDEKEATFDTSDGGDLIHVAVGRGDLLVVKYLIEQMHVNPNVKDSSRKTPLHAAAKLGNLDIVKYLVDEGKVDVNTEDNLGQNLLHQAIFGKNLDLVKYVVDNLNMSSRINEMDDEHRTAAMEAARQGQLSILKFLIDEKHANETISDLDGKNLLHYAVKSGVDSLAMLKYLIEEKEMDVNAQTKAGETPYDFGRKRNACSKVLQFLESKLSKIKSISESNRG